MCSEKEILFARTQKIVKLNITTHWIWPKRVSEGSKKSANFLLSTWNLDLPEIIFVTDVEVLTAETFFKRKAGKI